MKKRRVWRLFLGAAVAVLAGCASSTMSRIDSNRAEYETWPVEVQEAVLNKRVIQGMTPDQVTMSMGKPTSVENRPGKQNDQEVWIYKTGGGGLSGLSGLPVNLGLGTSIGPVGVYSNKSLGGGSNGVSQEEQDEVIFENGAVVKTDIAH
jgi:hypothetical protein